MYNIIIFAEDMIHVFDRPVEYIYIYIYIYSHDDESHETYYIL